MKTYTSLFIFMLVLLVSSCTKILTDFEFENKDPKLVIQAKFKADTTTLILVTRSLDMYDRREVKGIEDATVSLLTENGSRLNCSHDSGGWYSITSDQIHVAGSYQLEVEKEGYPTAISSFIVPAVPVINRIDTSTVRELSGPYGGSYIRGKLTVFLNDNPATEDYYIISVFKDYPYYEYNDFGYVIDTSVYKDYIYCYTSSPFVELSYDNWAGYVDWKDESERYGNAFVLTDKYFNGDDNVAIELLFDPIFNELRGEGETMEEYLDVYVKAVDKHLFEYARAESEIDKTIDNPLAEPVTPYSSVENGYGLVYGESIARVPVNITGLISEEDYYNIYWK